MPHSLRAKIKGLRYNRIITEKDCDRLCNALDNDKESNADLLEIKEALERKISILKEMEKETDYNEWYVARCVARRYAFEEVIELINCYILEDEE